MATNWGGGRRRQRSGVLKKTKNELIKRKLMKRPIERKTPFQRLQDRVFFTTDKENKKLEIQMSKISPFSIDNLLINCSVL